MSVFFQFPTCCIGTSISTKNHIDKTVFGIASIDSGCIDIAKGSKDTYREDCGRSEDILTAKRLLSFSERRTAPRVSWYNFSVQQLLSMPIVFTPTKPSFNEADGVSLGKIDDYFLNVCRQSPTCALSIGTVMCTPSSAILPTTVLGMVIMSEQSSSFLFRRAKKN